jgi:hypothetical protein
VLIGGITIRRILSIGGMIEDRIVYTVGPSEEIFMYSPNCNSGDCWDAVDKRRGWTAHRPSAPAAMIHSNRVGSARQQSDATNGHEMK